MRLIGSATHVGRLVVVGVVVALGIATWPPPGPVSAQQPTRGGTLVVALGGNPPHLNLGPSISFLVYQVASNVYGYLVRYDKEMKWQPDLAESWERSRDGLTLTFRLRRGALWHDGRSVTAEDVRFTFDQIHARYGGNTENWTDVKVEAPDDHTVIFRLPKYDALLDSVIGNFYSPIYPRHLWRDFVDTADALLRSPHARRPIGTGPFKFSEFIPGRHIELLRNEQYFMSGLPYLDRVVFRILPSPESRLAAIEAGEIDLMPRDINLNEVERLRRLPHLKVEVSQTTSGKFYVIFANVRKGPLANPVVRQAISHAINRDRIAKLALFGLGTPGWNPLLNSAAPHVKGIVNPNVPKYPHSFERARELLEQAGYPAGADGKRFSMRLLVETTLPANIPIAELVKFDLQQVGITVNLQKVDTATAQDLVYLKNDFDLYIVRIITFNAPVLQMNRRITTAYIRPGLALNAVGYSNKEVDALFERANAESDPGRRGRLLNRIQEILATELPMIPLAEEPDPRAYKADLVGMPDAALGDETYERVWRRR